MSSSPRATAQAEARRADDSELKLAGYAKVALPVLVLMSAIAAGMTQGVQGVVLALAGGALIGVIVVFWASLRTFLGETPLAGADAYALGAPRAEEEQKRAILRALKDLEFERSVGKISEADYAVLTAKYRLEAKRLLKLLDEDSEPEREHIEDLIARRLRQAGLAEPEPAEEAADAAADAEGAQEAERKRSAGKRKRGAGKHAAAKGAPEAASPACGACGTANDVDALFCKKCGARLAGAEAPRAADDAKKSDERDSGGDREDDASSGSTGSPEGA